MQSRLCYHTPKVSCSSIGWIKTIILCRSVNLTQTNDTRNHQDADAKTFEATALNASDKWKWQTCPNSSLIWLMCSHTSLELCCVVLTESTEVAWHDRVSQDPMRQWTCSRSYLTRHYGFSLSDCVMRHMGGINTGCSSALVFCVVCMLIRPSLKYNFDDNLYFHSMLLVPSPCRSIMHVERHKGPCAKQHNSMSEIPLGHARPSALQRVMSGRKRKQNMDPLVSFWWQCYHPFVVLDCANLQGEDGYIWSFFK